MLKNFLDWVVDRLGTGGLRLLASVIQRLPLESAVRLGSHLGNWSSNFLSRRKVAYVNLKWAFPESAARQRKQWTKELFRHLGMTAVEILRVPVLKEEDLKRFVTHHNYDILLDHHKGRKGVIFLTLHMGNWELSQVIEALRSRPLTILARKQKHPQMDAFLNSLRAHYGTRSIKKGAGTRDFIRTLREGGSVGVLGDQSAGSSGVWVRFFGRLTTAPRGPMALAMKLGIPIVPVFCVRRGGPYHDIFFLPPFQLERSGDLERDIQVNTQNYVNLLESYIRRYPSQWLWGHKRWKHTRTKRIVILSDGKPGHWKQSEALAREMVEKGREKVPPYEIEVEKIDVKFRSPSRKKLFPLFALFFLPWVQGRLHALRFFFEAGLCEKLETASADWVVSCGSSLVPLNLLLARENLSKTVVLMKPSFPFNLFRYPLALVPKHDRGWMPRGHFRIQGAFSRTEPGECEEAKRLLSQSLRDPARVRLSVFLGGETRHFKLTLSSVEGLIQELERVSEKLGGDFLLTTSRRTPPAIEDYLKTRLQNHPRCQLCVLASEDPRSEVVPGMMGLADFLIITEDSLSMISEALHTGKKMVIVKLSQNGIPKKHLRFQANLAKEWNIPVVDEKTLSKILENGMTASSKEKMDREHAQVREKLESLF